MDDIERRAPMEVRENNLPFFFSEKTDGRGLDESRTRSINRGEIGSSHFFLHLQSESMEDQLHACTSMGDPD